MANTKILIVENNAPFGREIEERIKTLGYTVCASVSDGARAIEKVPELQVDLVMVDIGLEGAMAAVDAAEAMHYRFDIPVICLIDSVEKDVLERINEAKVLGHIFKPFYENQLWLGIEHHLRWHKSTHAITESCERLSTILDNVGDAVITSDREGWITFMNPAAESLTGWEMEEASGKQVTDVLDIHVGNAGNLERSTVLVEALQKGSIPAGELSSDCAADYSTSLVAKSGRDSPIDYSITPIKDKEGLPAGIVMTIRDVTMYKTREEQLNQSISGLRHKIQLVKTVFDKVSDGIAVLDLTGQILFTNPSMQQLFGPAPLDTLPDKWSETYGVFYPDKETPVPLGLLLSTHFSRGEAIRDQGLFVRNKEQPEGVHVRASAIPLFDENREVIACVFFVRDILRAGLETTYSFGEIVGTSQIMQQMFALMQRAAGSDITVLISGESGTGKELVARAIHFSSPRKGEPFIAVNCAAIPETLIESELFGHEKGAFTGATTKRIGKFEQANQGTIFFDEIGDMPSVLQAKLLRVLQEWQIQRVGGTANIPVDIRVLTATNQDLEAAVEAGTFRKDLFYRIAAFPIEVHPLKDRREDIPLLADHFLKKYAGSMKKSIKAISADALRLLMQYDFPGNVRELENVIERAVLLETTELLQSSNLPQNIRSIISSEPILFFRDPTEIPLFQEVERQTLAHALKVTDNNISKAAHALNIDRSTLYRKLKLYQLLESD